MKDFRPIFCCHLIYKVFSKIIANMLKVRLPRFIAVNQSAFVKDKLLIENLLLATEIVKDFHKLQVSARCAIKIDIFNAFDSVQCSFLLNVSSAMDFSPQFIHQIFLCNSTAFFSVQINRELVGYFQSRRGLRQGCSLSPYLFVMVMDVLSKLLDRTASNKLFGYHPRCNNLGLTHLSFADDFMVLTDGKIRLLEGIVKVFDEFSKASGLRISMEKTTVYLGESSCHEITSKFQFTTGHFPVKYLGLPLTTKCMTSGDYLPLLEDIKKRINSWKLRFLSFVGRLELIKSVLQSITNFWMGAFRLQSSYIQDIEKLCSTFLWSGHELNPKKANISWEEITEPKEEGRLRCLRESNKVCCLKLLWIGDQSLDSPLSG